ncbi:hypothetical protein D3C85_187540 [compost metagenome]
MKLATYLLLLIGFTQLYSQNINLEQLTLWRQTNYKIVDEELLKMGWEKSISKETEDIYRNDQYFLNKGSKNEKVLTLMYTNDYKLENNCISYNAIKDQNFDNFLNQIKSSDYKEFKSNKNENVISDYYQSDKLTVIASILKGIDEQMQEIKFYTIYLSTSIDYHNSHKD